MTRITAIILAGIAFALPAQADELVDAGAKVFKKCAACHVADKKQNKIGPTLNGIVGRKAASIADYKYSEGSLAHAKETGEVWDEAKLDTYLTDPKAYIPKNKMAFPGLKNPDDRKAVIAYLKSIPVVP
jgi:cytochrome c